MLITLRSIELRLCEEKIPYQSDVSEILEKGVYIKRPEDVFRLFRFLSERVQEEVYALYMDGKRKLLGFYQVAKGTMSYVGFTPADVLRPALIIGASSVILVHNHPSGDPEPSEEDRQLTDRLKMACGLLGLTLDDHLVICRCGFNSCL